MLYLTTARLSSWRIYKLGLATFVCFVVESTYQKPSFLFGKKAILLQTWTGPEGSRRLRLSDFKKIDTWRW
jgi:hypothetical protein